MRQPFKNRPELEVGTNLYNLRLTPFFPLELEVGTNLYNLRLTPFFPRLPPFCSPAIKLQSDKSKWSFSNLNSHQAISFCV